MNNVIGISVETVQTLIRFASRATLTRAEWRSLEAMEADFAKFIADSKAAEVAERAKAEADKTPKE